MSRKPWILPLGITCRKYYTFRIRFQKMWNTLHSRALSDLNESGRPSSVRIRTFYTPPPPPPKQNCELSLLGWR